MNLLINKLKECKYAFFKKLTSTKIDDNLSFTPKINKYLDDYLTKFHSYLEYGSGLRTIYFSKKNIHKIISVESVFNFANAVEANLKSKNLQKTIVLKADIGLTRYWGYPLFNKNFKKKVGNISIHHGIL